MDKVEFFNEIMKVHDGEDNKYDEKIADYLLCTQSDEFSIFYEIYLRINEVYKVKPYIFKFTDEGVESFSLKTSKKDFLDIFNELKENGLLIKGENIKAKCTYKKNEKRNLIYISIKILNHIHTVNDLTLLNGVKVKVIN